jgi:hypothetical protein
MKVNIEIEGIPVTLEYSKHAKERLGEREVSPYEAASLVLKLGEKILEMTNGEIFGVIDKELKIGIICSISTIGLEIFIDIVTVLRSERIYFSQGMKVLEFNDKFNDIWGQVS